MCLIFQDSGFADAFLIFSFIMKKKPRGKPSAYSVSLLLFCFVVPLTPAVFPCTLK